MTAKYSLAALLALFAAVGVLWLTQSSPYYPLVQVQFADQSELTFLDNPWTTLAACQESTQKIVAKLHSSGGVITQNQCDTQLAEPWRSVLLTQNSTETIVYSGTLRIVIRAPNAAKTICQDMAAQIQAQQKNEARCVLPVGR